MIPFMKLPTRRFHITSNIFLRKVSKTVVNDPKDEFPENNSSSSSCNEITCPDYLGIETEENVISLKSQKHQLQQPKLAEARERFYRASFGIVRFDADNKLKYHGEYNKKFDFTFPQSSSEFVKVNKILENSSEDQNDKFFSLNASHNLSGTEMQKIKKGEFVSDKKDSNDMNYIDKSFFGRTETDIFDHDQKNQKSPQELNFLEKNYFGSLADSDVFLVEQNDKSRNSAFCNENSTEESNYLEDNSENLHEKKYIEDPPKLIKIDSNIEDKLEFQNNTNHLKELSYLEKDFFNNLNNSEDQIKEIDTSKHSDFINDVVAEYSDQSNELNYLEKNYFGNHYHRENITDSADCDYEQKINPEFCIKDQSTSSDVGSNNTSAKLRALDKIYSNQNSDMQNSSYFAEKVVLNQNIKYNQLRDVKQKSETKYKTHTPVVNNKIESNEESIIQLKKLNQKHSNETVTKLKQYSSSKMQKFDELADESTETYMKDSNKLHNETVKSITKQNNFKFSNLISEKLDQDHEISTAHDYVKKLREEQKVSIQNNNISKENSIEKEKTDSKGFRILKNQVPNLSFFTRDEIFNILKQNVVYSDEDLIVLNKPYNLVIHESETTKEPCLSMFLDDLAKEMDNKATSPKLFTVHRLDKETTGCILLARNETMAMHLKALFAQRKIIKKYWIITAGVPDPPEGVIDIPISEGSVNGRKRMVLHPKLPNDIPYKSHSRHGKPAVTTYKVISESGNAALVEVFPKTGVKHQIRVHFGFGLGCPILGDHKYSHLDKLAPQKLPSDMLQRLYVRQSKVRHIPMHIHAKSVVIPDYFDKRDLFVNIPIPDHMKLNLKRLKFRKKDMIH